MIIFILSPLNLLYPPSPFLFLGVMEQTRSFRPTIGFYSVLCTPEYVRTAMDGCANDTPSYYQERIFTT